MENDRCIGVVGIILFSSRWIDRPPLRAIGVISLCKNHRGGFRSGPADIPIELVHCAHRACQSTDELDHITGVEIGRQIGAVPIARHVFLAWIQYKLGEHRVG